MRKEIILYIITLVILLGLYLLVASQAVKITSEKSPPESQAKIQAANQSSGFRGPAGSPSVKGAERSAATRIKCGVSKVVLHVLCQG